MRCATGSRFDATGRPLPQVIVSARGPVGDPVHVHAADDGRYRFDRLQADTYEVSFQLTGFATTVVRRVGVSEGRVTTLDATLYLSASASVVVPGRGTFRDLSTVSSAGELIGVAESATSGVITAAELDERSRRRAGEALERVPGVIVSQHAGEGKANQYYIRGFNIDHGTDLALSVSGMPVNLPTHGHGQGHADLSFLIPELVGSIQYRKGPYFAGDGDFSAAGSVRMKYVNVYVNAGGGFHSNDGRGSTIRRDPVTGEPADRVDPLVRATGSEVGLRTLALPGVHTSIAFWGLWLDSELVFVGDAGTTVSSRPSRRHGVEWSLDYTPSASVALDATVAWSRARFTGPDPAGSFIPGAVESVAGVGLTLRPTEDWSGRLQWRYFGGRPLVEDNSVRSDASSMVNAEIGYRLGRRWRLEIDILSLFDADDSDVDYFYTSRLPGEPAAGVADIHFHPVEPFTLRTALVWSF